MATKKTGKRGTKPTTHPETANASPLAKTGRKHQIPIAVAYQRAGDSKVTVTLLHPSQPTEKTKTSTGLHAALGAFMDDGFVFAPLREEVPEWAMGRLPEGATPIGSGRITSFPFGS